MKIAFFIGCASNVFTSGAVKRMLRYLVSLGAEVHLPKVACCGEPHRSAADWKEMRRLAKTNALAVFSGDYDFIVSDCSTCAHALKHYDQFVEPDSREMELIEPRLGKVLELNSLLMNHLNFPTDKLKALEARVTYHDSCHAVRGLDVQEAPREILRRLPGLELAEMRGADSCCGGAGSYGFTHPGISGAIAERKVKHIIESGATIVATSCPACTLQLGAALRREGRDITVRHPIDLLAESFVSQ